MQARISFYNSQTVCSKLPLSGILLADQFSNYGSAEFDYLYHDGHPFLQARGVRSDIQGNSDAITCGLLFHFKPREHRWRPFVAGGTGAKEYVIAGRRHFRRRFRKLPI